MLKKINVFINCNLFKTHNWTSAVEEGIKATPEQLKSEDGFWDYAKMYCKDCGHVYEESQNLLEQHKD